MARLPDPGRKKKPFLGGDDCLRARNRIKHVSSGWGQERGRNRVHGLSECASYSLSAAVLGRCTASDQGCPQIPPSKFDF